MTMVPESIAAIVEGSFRQVKKSQAGATPDRTPRLDGAAGPGGGPVDGASRAVVPPAGGIQPSAAFSVAAP